MLDKFHFMLLNKVKLQLCYLDCKSILNLNELNVWFEINEIGGMCSLMIYLLNIFCEGVIIVLHVLGSVSCSTKK